VVDGHEVLRHIIPLNQHLANRGESLAIPNMIEIHPEITPIAIIRPPEITRALEINPVAHTVTNLNIVHEGIELLHHQNTDRAGAKDVLTNLELSRRRQNREVGISHPSGTAVMTINAVIGGHDHTTAHISEM